MAKKKKKKDAWVSFVNRIFNRPRANRQYNLPADYIMSVADKIHKTNPSLEITYNTLVEMAGVIFEKGYERKAEDVKWFKEKQEKRIREGFNAFKDWLEDFIQGKNQNKK